MSTVGTVLDSSNPVGLILDRKGGATAPAQPGIHLSQATSTARPFLSARVNLLRYSDAPTFSGSGAAPPVVTNNATYLGSTCAKLDFPVMSGGYGVSIASASATSNSDRPIAGPVTEQYVIAISRALVSGESFVVGMSSTGGVMDLAIDSVNCAAFVGAFETASKTNTFTVGVGVTFPVIFGDTINSPITVYVKRVQLNPGSTALPYQRVGAASDYTATGFPAYLKFDGTDDSLATATFSAGTLTSSMDCLVAVRRDSAAATYLISDTVSRGFFEWESGDTNRPDVGAGMPTYYVDGVACTATRGALFTALAAGSWHILEVRGLDLTTWTALGVSSFVSYRLNGALGGIQLFASGQDANRDKARARMAAYFGVTLA